MKRLIALLCFTLLLYACSEPPAPEAALRAWLAEAETLIEARDRGAVADLISEDYADARGNSRDDLERILLWWFTRQKSIALLVDIDELTLQGDTAAQVTLTAGMAGTNSSALGFSADAYRFELALEDRGDGWELIGARWGELGGELR